MVLTWTSYFVNYKTKTRDVLTFTLQRWTCNECGIGQDLAVLMQSRSLLCIKTAKHFSIECYKVKLDRHRNLCPFLFQMSIHI